MRRLIAYSPWSVCSLHQIGSA